MKIVDIGLNILTSLTTSVPLAEAKTSAPNSMECYKIYLNNQLKYVGKAEDGLRKRFVQYYNGTTARYPSSKKIYENRDKIKVSWQTCTTREECRRLESQWIKQYNPEWNERSGWKNY